MEQQPAGRTRLLWMHFWKERMEHHTIDAANPESLQIVCSLIDQYLPLFRSEYFNICCDETWDLGKGRNDGKDPAELYINFIRGVQETGLEYRFFKVLQEDGLSVQAQSNHGGAYVLL